MCGRERESVCVCDIDIVCVVEKKSVFVCGKTEFVCVIESVCGRERVCVCVCVRDTECVWLCVVETDCMCVCVPKCVCGWSERKNQVTTSNISVCWRGK